MVSQLTRFTSGYFVSIFNVQERLPLIITHKVAISNHCIKAIDEECNVTFKYKDYADEEKKKLMTLSGQEFLRRFEQHILPKGFVKIRSYGYQGNFRRKSLQLFY